MFSRCDYLKHKLAESKMVKAKHKIVSATCKGGHMDVGMIGMPCVVLLPELVVSAPHLRLIEPYLGLIQQNTGVDPRTLKDPITLDWDKLVVESDHEQLRKVVSALFPKQTHTIMVYMMFLSDLSAATNRSTNDFLAYTSNVSALHLLFDKPPLLLDTTGKTIDSPNLERELDTYFHFSSARKGLDGAISSFLGRNRYLTINLQIEDSRYGLIFFHILSKFVDACSRVFGHWQVHKSVCISTAASFLIDAATINIYAIPDVIPTFSYKHASNGFVLEVILSNNKFQTAVFEDSMAAILYRFIFAGDQEGVFEVDGEPIVYSDATVAACMQDLAAVINRSTKAQNIRMSKGESICVE